MYKYKAKCLKPAYDADSMDLIIDLGCNVFIHEKVRLYAIDTPELRTKNLKEKKLGYEARDFVRELLKDREFIIETFKDKKGKFGRYLVNIILKDGVTLNNILIDKKFARPYYGDKKKPWVFD